jgi:hypothetical protein
MLNIRSLHVAAVCLMLSLVHTSTILQSIPFDPFRLECQRQHGLMELSMRLVASEGGERTDMMFTVACDNLNERFPLSDEIKEQFQVNNEN